MINIQEIPKTSGIYKITSPTNKIYIGQSIDIFNRWNQYKKLKSSIKQQPKIYNSLKFYGINNHTFEIIEECPISQLDKKELWYKLCCTIDISDGRIFKIFPASF